MPTASSCRQTNHGQRETGRDGMDETVVMFYVCIFLGGIVYTFHKVDTWIFRSQNRNMV